MKRFFSSQKYKIFVENFEGLKEKILLIPGAYHTGICYTDKPDGSKGWALRMAEKGLDTYVTDLPGFGRSGYLPFESINGQLYVEAYQDLIENKFNEKIILLTHSLSGPIGLKLAEVLPQKIRAVISVEPGLIGNIQEKTQPNIETQEKVEVKFKGFDLILNRKELSLPSKQFMDRVTKEYTKRFPQKEEVIEQYISSLQPTHPQLLYERFNINGSQLSINDFSKMKDVDFLFITGTEDPVHIDEDYKIVDKFQKEGLRVDYYKLGELGIYGNGHMMMLENNSDEIVNLIIQWISKIK